MFLVTWVGVIWTLANKLQLSTLLSIITVLNAHALLINRKLYAGQIICHKQQQNSLYTFANFEIVIALFEQWRNLISLSSKLKDNQFSASFLKKRKTNGKHFLFYAVVLCWWRLESANESSRSFRNPYNALLYLLT